MTKIVIDTLGADMGFAPIVTGVAIVTSIAVISGVAGAAGFLDCLI